MTNFSRKNLIEKTLVAGFYLVVCFLLFVPAGKAQIKKNNIREAANQNLLAEAASALDSENLTRAEDILQKMLLSEPRNLPALTLAGVTADRQNNLALAEKHFAKAAQIAPGSSEARNNYGAILLRQNKKEAAAREFAASLKINPNQSSALINLAKIRFAENDFRAARELFIKAEAVAPDAEIARALVIISLQLDEKERAAREFKKYFTTPVFVSDATLGELLLNKDLLPEAQRELEYVLAKNAANVDALIALSRVHLARKNVTAAGKLLESAVARGIADAKIYSMLASVYQTAGYPENAIPAMRLAIEKDSNNETYKIQYGLLLIDSKAPAAAAIRIEEAIKDFPKSARLRLLLGMAHFTIGKSNEAREAFESALTIDPKLVPALGYLATILTEQGKFDEAVKIYEKTLGFADDNALIHYLLAETLLKTQNPFHERVESELKRAVALDKDLAAAHSVLGRLYVRQNRFDQARAVLERAVELNPNLTDALYQLGLVYARLKLTDESKAVFAKFKELNASQGEENEKARREIVRRLANTNF